MFFLFCYCANEPTKPHLKIRILSTSNFGWYILRMVRNFLVFVSSFFSSLDFQSSMLQLCNHLHCRGVNGCYFVKLYMKYFIYWSTDVKSSKLWSYQHQLLRLLSLPAYLIIIIVDIFIMGIFILSCSMSYTS